MHIHMHAAVVLVGRKDVLEGGGLSKHIPNVDEAQLKAMLEDVQVGDFQYTQTHTPRHAVLYTHIHTHACRIVYTHTLPCMPYCIHTYKPMHAVLYTHIHTHACRIVYTHTHTCMPYCIHQMYRYVTSNTHTHACMQFCICRMYRQSHA